MLDFCGKWLYFLFVVFFNIFVVLGVLEMLAQPILYWCFA